VLVSTIPRNLVADSDPYVQCRCWGRALNDGLQDIFAFQRCLLSSPRPKQSNPDSVVAVSHKRLKNPILRAGRLFGQVHHYREQGRRFASGGIVVYPREIATSQICVPPLRSPSRPQNHLIPHSFQVSSRWGGHSKLPARGVVACPLKPWWKTPHPFRAKERGFVEKPISKLSSQHRQLHDGGISFGSTH